MALKVWIGENLERRHEQEQMKEFLSLMHAYYDNLPATVHILCNFICGGSQIDAAVVKTDAFIPIEFKTAGGPVYGSENGKWKFEDPDTCREIQLGGGSHASNPYNQVANARTAIAQKMEVNENVFFRRHECDRVADWRHFVHGLVVLAPNLDEGFEDEIDVDFYAKPWFDCCRMKDVAEVVSKTTTRDGELSNKNILNIISHVLHLERAEMCDGVPVLHGTADFKNEPESDVPLIKSDDNFGQTLGDLFPGQHQPNTKKPVPIEPLPKKQLIKAPDPVETKSVPSVRPVAKPLPPSPPPPPETMTVAVTSKMLIDDPQVKTSLENIKGFMCEDLPEYVENNVVACAKQNAADLPVPIEGDWEYVIEVKYKGDAKRALDAVNGYWPCPYTHPYVAGDVIVWRFPDANSVERKGDNQIRSVALQGIGFLPPMMEDFISKHPNARYSPDALTASSNLTADAQRAEWYLGTYFPRSFCETFAIFDYIFGKKYKELKINDSLSILDIGIGSGGATYGLIWALRKWFKNKIKEINVIGYDGNDHALELCGDIACVLVSRWDVSLNINTSNVRITQDTMNVVANQKFDFVLASKAIQEMTGGFGYDDFVSLSRSCLNPTGIAILLEIFSENRQVQIKASLKTLNADSQLLVSSVEGPCGAAFGVISNLTTQIMEETISFAAWGGNELSTEEKSEIEVVCRKPRKTAGKRKANISPIILSV